MGKVVLILLVVLNLFLAANLVRSGSAVPAAEGNENAHVQQAAEVAVPVQAKESVPVAVPKTEFASVYASDPKVFAANLRRAGCPEETVRDILVAEIGRRYHSREEDLRPKPGDHLPFGWSAKTQGFWQSEDIAELERLKAERQATIEELQEGRPREER